MKNEEPDNGGHIEFDLSTIEGMGLAGHSWVQMGFHLICQSCAHEHAINMQPGYMYFGNDAKGKPIVKKVW
jgi:hypothetical protein